MSKPVIIEFFTNDFGGSTEPLPDPRKEPSPDGRCLSIHQAQFTALMGLTPRRCELPAGHKGLCHDDRFQWATSAEQAMEALDGLKRIGGEG